ncbi:hypothetical protein TorRG33x02_149330 [Trema orientale]|uniref:Uncharacterized protein n=1 Tax=Trema orientale TaxID=63057 RepID=A0A2P5EUP3_TREOI|nr:hypothetical protein TorRG33x02_149330 [Trema orientale]
MSTTLTTPLNTPPSPPTVNAAYLTKKKGKARAIDEFALKTQKTSALSGLTKNAQKKKAKEAAEKIVVKESLLRKAKIAQDDYKQKLDNAIKQIHDLEHSKGKAKEAEEKLKAADDFLERATWRRVARTKVKGEQGTGILVIGAQPEIDEMIAELSGNQHF